LGEAGVGLAYLEDLVALAKHLFGEGIMGLEKLPLK